MYVYTYMHANKAFLSFTPGSFTQLLKQASIDSTLKKLNFFTNINPNK